MTEEIEKIISIEETQLSNNKIVLEQLNLRVTSLEKIADTIKDIAEPAIKSVSDYLDKKASNQKRQLELEDKQQGRSIWVLLCGISAIFVLCMTALLKNQIDLVKVFIQSGLGVAAGSGIVAFIKGRSKRNSEQGLD